MRRRRPGSRRSKSLSPKSLPAQLNEPFKKNFRPQYLAQAKAKSMRKVQKPPRRCRPVGELTFFKKTELL